MKFISESINKVLKFPVLISFLLKLSFSKILTIDFFSHEVWNAVFQKRPIHSHLLFVQKYLIL